MLRGGHGGCKPCPAGFSCPARPLTGSPLLYRSQRIQCGDCPVQNAGEPLNAVHLIKAEAGQKLFVAIALSVRSAS